MLESWGWEVVGGQGGLVGIQTAEPHRATTGKMMDSRTTDECCKRPPGAKGVGKHVGEQV